MDLQTLSWTLLLMFSITACDQASKVSPTTLSAEELDAVMNEGGCSLGPGLGPDAVASQIGEPYNDRNELVWIWPFDESRPSGLRSWRAFVDGEAYFVIFVNGVTVGPPRSTASVYPWELYAVKMKVAEDAVPAAYRK